MIREREPRLFIAPSGGGQVRTAVPRAGVLRFVGFELGVWAARLFPVEHAISGFRSAMGRARRGARRSSKAFLPWFQPRPSS